MASCLNSAFLLFKPHSNEPNTCPISDNEEIFCTRAVSHMLKSSNVQIRKYKNAFRTYCANAQIKMCKFTNAFSNS